MIMEMFIVVFDPSCQCLRLCAPREQCCSFGKRHCQPVIVAIQASESHKDHLDGAEKEQLPSESPLNRLVTLMLAALKVAVHALVTVLLTRQSEQQASPKI